MRRRMDVSSSRISRSANFSSQTWLAIRRQPSPKAASECQSTQTRGNECRGNRDAVPPAEPGGKPGDQVKCYRCKRKYPRPDPRMQNQPQCCPNCGTKPPSLWPFSEKAIRTAGAAANWTKTSRLRGELLAAFEQGSVEQFLHGLGVADPQTPTIGAQPTSSAADLDRWLEIRRQANARADLVLAPNLARGKR